MWSGLIAATSDAGSVIAEENIQMNDNRLQKLHLYGRGAGVEWLGAAVFEMPLQDGKIWSGHMKGSPLAQEEVLSNSIGYYYRRLLKSEPKEHTDCFLTAQAGWDRKRSDEYLWETR